MNILEKGRKKVVPRSKYDKLQMVLCLFFGIISLLGKQWFFALFMLLLFLGNLYFYHKHKAKEEAFQEVIEKLDEEIPEDDEGKSVLIKKTEKPKTERKSRKQRREEYDAFLDELDNELDFDFDEDGEDDNE